MSYFLIIDDDPVIRQLLGRALEGKGYRVKSVSSASLAMSFVHHEAPAVIVVDVMMPGCSGPSLARLLVAHPNGHKAHIVFYTSLTAMVPFERPSTFIEKDQTLPHVVDKLINCYESAAPAA